MPAVSQAAPVPLGWPAPAAMGWVLSIRGDLTMRNESWFAACETCEWSYGPSRNKGVTKRELAKHEENCPEGDL